MKYPQLVSTRAVNAISDWLVARLEQLGVEAPHIYTRLLLSLLQSTVQLNDPIEFSNLESFLASRKGGHRRYRECDIDELKKFNAVQCIKDIVSSDQEIATIENLVEELYERLKDIEKQSSDSEDDELPVATLSITQRHNSSQQRREVPAHSKSCRASCVGDSSGRSARNAEAAGTSASTRKLNEREEDYCRAFPTLSKQMGESFDFWRRTAKWLTWPAEKPNDDGDKQNASTSSDSSTISSNSEAEGGHKEAPTNANVQHDIKEESEEDEVEMLDESFESTESAAYVSGAELCDDIVDENDENDDEDEAGGGANAAGQACGGGGAIKRNTKRRRSRALSRKNPAGGADSNNAGNNRAQASGGKNKRNLSPNCWDTDFEGCWEMGPDLIKEFITSQNRNTRNRSTSESAVSYNMQRTTDEAVAKHDETFVVATHDEQQPNEACLDENKPTAEDEKVVSANKAITTPALPPVDISFCDYDDFDDTLASVSELTNDGPLAMLATGEGACAVPPAGNAKRLYERELLPKNTKTDVQSDFAQFEAKFNSSVEALWKDAERDGDKGFSPFGDGNKFHAFDFVRGSSSSNKKNFSGPTSLPNDVPFSQNLKNFWSNYYNHHFDLSKMLPTSVIGEKAKELDVLMQNKANDNVAAAFKPNVGGISEANNFANAQQADANTTAGPTSDYYSMPSNLEEIERAKSQRSGLRHNSGCSDSGNVRRGGGTIGAERKTPVALFLQNSIWSESANFGGGDSDETFYFKVHNAGNQLNAYDDNNREEKLHCDTTTGSSFAFTAPYSASKWSEGINAGPPAGNMATPLLPLKQCGNQNTNFHISLNPADCTDSSSSGACTPGASNWHLTKADAKNDLQNAWCADTNAARRSPRDTDSMAMPKMTLVNHSATSSGFLAYSRIKAVLKLQLCSDDDAAVKQQQQRNYPPRSNSKEQQQQQQRYALDMLDDGENLLTSERTHFRPIKSYVDGHTFDICNELDVIEYERSASGYLYYEEEKYLEYTRTDNFIVEDDGGIGASANPLYANSNCEAATASANAKANYASHAKIKRVERDFVIKFRVQRTEMACQTDPEPPTARALVSANKRSGIVMNAAKTKTPQPHPISLIFSNAAKNLKATAANELVYSDTVEAFTRAMAHFPPPPQSSSSAASNNANAWLSIGAADVGGGQAAGSSNWNIYQEQSKLQANAKNNNKDDDDDDDTGCDEVDFYGSLADIAVDMEQNDNMAMPAAHAEVDLTSLEQQWSMNEIRKKCKEAGHMTTYNGNATNAADGVDGAVESVWGMCAACNNEMKSIPANRLLRDELQVEADEIMSDLKYMQDLYIGSAGDGDGADADDEDDIDGGADDESVAETVTSDSDWCAEDVTAEVADECAAADISANSVNNNELNEEHTADDSTVNNNNNDSETFTVIQKVNRLIAELLRPDNNGDGVMRTDKLNANAACAGATVNESRQLLEAEATQFSGNLWHTNSNERNIWQLNASDNTNGLIVAASGGGGVLGKSGSVSGGDGAGAGAMHPMQLLRQFNVKPIETAVASVDDNIFALPATADADKYHRQMSWEHENLARIWQTSPPSPPQTQKADNMTINDDDDDAKPQTAAAPAAAIAEDTKLVDHLQQADIAEKNMRNLRANADASVDAAAANLQLAQKFIEHKESKVAAALTNAQLVDSALKLKAITRKRRHSASQNYFHAHLNSTATAANAAVAAVSSLVGVGAIQSNNNNDIANLNSYTLRSLHNTRNGNELSLQNFLNASLRLRFGAAAAAAVAASSAKKCSDLTNNLCGADFAFGCDSTATSAGNQTIITCKYHLTAIEPLGIQQNDDGNGGDNEYGLFTGNGIGDGITAAPLASIIDKNPSMLKHVTMVSRPLTR